MDSAKAPARTDQVEPTTTPEGFSLVQPPDWMLEQDGRLRQFMNLPKDRLCIIGVPGIGDFAWVWSKLWSLAELKPVFVFPDDGVRRVQQYADILGIETHYCNYDIREVLKYDGQFTREEFAAAKDGGAFYVQANRWIESGKLLKDWCPDLPIRNPISDFMASWKEARAYAPQDYVTLHMCMHSYVEGNWLPKRWARLIESIEKNFAPVKVVGALWDVPFARRVFDFYEPKLKPCLDQPLKTSLEVITQGQAHLGLDSGLTILSKYLGVPALQAFPRWLCDPKPTAYHPSGTHMPDTYDLDFHPKSKWCFVDELMDEVEPWLETL